MRKTVEQDRVHLLSTIDLVITPADAADLKKPDHGICFDWGPDAGRYQAKIERKPSRAVDPLKLLEVMQKGSAVEEAK